MTFHWRLNYCLKPHIYAGLAWRGLKFTCMSGLYYGNTCMRKASLYTLAPVALLMRWCSCCDMLKHIATRTASHQSSATGVSVIDSLVYATENRRRDCTSGVVFMVWTGLNMKRSPNVNLTLLHCLWRWWPSNKPLEGQRTAFAGLRFYKFMNILPFSIHM